MNETGVETYSDSPDRAIAFILAQEAILSVQANVWIQREGFLLGKGDAFLDEGTVSEVDLSGTYVSLSMIEDGAFRTVQVISSSSLGEQDGAMYLFLDLDPTPSKGRVIKLRPGERIMVGVTDNPMVSSDGVIPPKHVALSVTNAGTLCVENSSSKAVLHRSPVYNDVSTQVENIAKSIRRERLTYGESALADFKEFCQRHDYEIRRYEAAGDVQGLRDFIRSLFLLGYEGKRPYGEQVYNLTEESLHDICRFDNNKVRVSTRGDWFYASTNGGITGRAEGRFYLNIIPEHAAELFGAIGRRAAKNGLHIEMKIPVDGDIRSLLRSDYYVIYCLSAEEGQLLSLLDEIHALTARSFRGSISRFCLPVKNAHGKVMEGVGFGEEPRERNVSFAGERAAILAEVLAQARSQGVKIYEDSFDIKAAYTMACIQHGVDPVSPAFNLRRWSLLKKQRFPILKGQYK